MHVYPRSCKAHHPAQLHQWESKWTERPSNFLEVTQAPIRLPPSWACLWASPAIPFCLHVCCGWAHLQARGAGPDSLANVHVFPIFKGVDSGTGLQELEPQQHRLLTGWCCTSHCLSLYLSFLISKMGIIAKSWKMMLWKCCTQYASKFGKLSSGHRTGKGQFSFQSQKKAMSKNAQTTAQLHSSHMLVN